MKSNKLIKIITVIFFVLILLLSIVFVIKNYRVLNNKKPIVSFETMLDAVRNRNGYYLNVAVLYVKDDDNYTAQTAIDYLKQSVMLGLNVSGIDISEQLPDFNKYDILYLDETLVNYENVIDLSNRIISYVKDGGNIFVANDLFGMFPYEFVGAKKFVRLKDAPIELKAPYVDSDLKQIQQTIIDFADLYKDYHESKLLQKQYYGVGIVSNAALPIIKYKGLSLYTLNKYGKGRVFFTNQLLPNKYSKGAFSLQKSKYWQAPFSNTTASFNQFIYGYFSSYIAKQIYGFSINRIFGSYTAPAMAWSVHYENIPGIKENALISFSKLVEQYNQIPSFSIARNAHHWFTRTETASYIINTSKDKKDMDFKKNLYYNPFFSGLYVLCDKKWLQLNTVNNYILRLRGNINQKVLFYPCLFDFDKDGRIDVLAGSSDGKMYYFKNLGFIGVERRLSMSRPKQLKIYVDGFSSPQLIDIDKDGVLDIISGANDGNIYFFKGLRNLDFGEKELLIKTDIQGVSLPAVGDVNQDGVPDIVVGSDTGVLLIYYGKMISNKVEYFYNNMSAISKQCADLELGKYLSPSIVDYDKDGLDDIILGTQDGYIAKLKKDKSNKFIFDGFILSDEMNVRGNYNLKFGMFANPRLLDLNNDGKFDIFVGYEDTGMPYPIDSSYFSLRKELSEQIEYAKSKNYYIGIHHFSGNYGSKRREKYEIEKHINVLKQYGVINKIIGMNQHVGATTKISEIDSYSRLYSHGVLWNSFFVPIEDDSYNPFFGVENSIISPFFIVQENEQKMLMQNAQTVIFCQTKKYPCPRKDLVNTGLRYETPIINVHHASYKANDDDKEMVELAELYRKKSGYNFVREDQMMLSIAAAYNLKLNVSEKDGYLQIVPNIGSDKFPLYDRDFQAATGIKIEFSSKLKDKIMTNAKIWQIKDDDLYIGLDDTVSLWKGHEEEIPHLLKVNIPARIVPVDNGVNLFFKYGGLMQVTVSGDAYSDNSDWDAQYDGVNTTFTKFGNKDNLYIIFRKKGK